MNIKVYEDIKTNLEKFMIDKGYSGKIVGFAPNQPNYPLIIIKEIRNVPFEKYNKLIETIANLSYRIDIYAKQIENKSKEDVARELAFNCNEFMTKNVGLFQNSWNIVDNDGQNGELYHIIIIYSRKYFEQRLRFI